MPQTEFPLSSHTTTIVDADERLRRRRQIAWYSAALACAILLRVTFPHDVTWEGDQKWMLMHARETGATAPWSWAGSLSSGGVPHPGMSLWLFIVLVRWLHLSTPLLVSQAVAFMSIAALALIGVWAIAGMRGAEREQWLWAGALAAVNPVDTFLERVIWAPSALPVFLVAFWFSFRNRRVGWGAFLWGALGACVAEIHLCGFFLFGGILLTAILSPSRREVRWIPFAAGLVVAGWPVIPWILTVAAGHYSPAHWGFMAHFPGKVWIWWFISDIGLGMRYITNNFWKQPFAAFLSWPQIAGHSTWGVLAVHCLLACVALVPVWWWLRDGIDGKGWMPAFLSGNSETAIVVRGCFFGFAGLLTLLPAPVFVHYFLVAFPVGFLCIARFWLCRRPDGARSRRGLAAVVVLNFMLSLASLFYVHEQRLAGPVDALNKNGIVSARLDRP